MMTIWNKETGEPRHLDSVDAREILRHGSEYTDVDPNPDAVVRAPVPIELLESPYRREPVGNDTPEPPREQPIIRNGDVAKFLNGDQFRT